MSNYLESVETPCYVLFEDNLEENLKRFEYVKEKTGCHIILALKAFSNYCVFPLISSYIDGSTASSLHEVRLGFEEFKKETHIYSPAYKASEMSEIAQYASHVVFNNFDQLRQFKSYLPSTTDVAVRLNPEHSEVKHAIYNPCSPFSRFGMTREEYDKTKKEPINGLMVHALCGNDSYALERLMKATEEKFGDIISEAKWFDFGGGHMITHPNYNLDHLCDIINRFQDKYQLTVVLEPGEALVRQTGVLVASVLDIIENGMKIAILDTSATAHMPDVMEMPYRPEVENAGHPGDYQYTYRFGSVTCLSGDVIGDYSFEIPLHIGDKIVFQDMAQYTSVKNTTFNGITLPSIAVVRKDKSFEVIKQFGYEMFKSRL